MKRLINSFLLFFQSLLLISIRGQAPEILVHPVSINTTEGSVVEFTCVASNSPSAFGFAVDAETPDTSKGFIEQPTVPLGGGNVSRSLQVTASVADNNNSMIVCQAVNVALVGDTSGIAILRVQGPLSSVVDLSYYFINSSTVTISWSPPFTLPGTDITGYNISATSNGTTTNYFTSNSYYQLSLTDITDSPCDVITITVSGYNGLDGETTNITGIYLPTVPSNEIKSVSHTLNENRYLSLFINVSNLCIGEYPLEIKIRLTNHQTITMSFSIPLSQVNVIELSNVTVIQQYIEYTMLLTYANLAGDFNFNNSLKIFTYSVESARVLNSSNSTTVCIECVFSTFTTDNAGCTVVLESTNSTQLIYTFNKSSDDSNTGSGCIGNIDTGRYIITVYDSNTVIPVTNNIIELCGGPTTVPEITKAASTDYCICTALETSSIVSPSSVVIVDTPSTQSEGSFVVSVFLSGFFPGIITGIIIEGIIVVVSVLVYRRVSIGTSTHTPPHGSISGNNDIVSTSNPAYEVITLQRQQQRGNDVVIKRI